MDLDSIKLNETERQILYVIGYMWNLKNKTNVYNKKESRLTDTENKLVVTSGEREVRRGNIGEEELRGTNH